MNDIRSLTVNELRNKKALNSITGKVESLYEIIVGITVNLEWTDEQVGLFVNSLEWK